MGIENFINYQGSKSNIINFIMEGITDYAKLGDCVLDLFFGSGAVSSALDPDFVVYANDVELYSATLGRTILLPNSLNKKTESEIKRYYEDHFTFLQNEMQLGIFIDEEQGLLKQRNIKCLQELYDRYPTVWNNKTLTPKKLRKEGKYNLFCSYYAGSYFGIKQAAEIDSLIYAFNKSNYGTIDALFSCLFYAMKETVFSKDGHMAQPLALNKYPTRAVRIRGKSVYEYFVRILRQLIAENDVYRKHKNKVFNQDFESLIADADIMGKVDLVYADPPYTDMQYSRYYHLLNVARNYDYPELTRTSRGFTTGLYTEGRFQSDLSKKSKARYGLETLIETCAKNNIILALSYAYPQNTKVQATNRYTVSVEDLIEMAKVYFSPRNVNIRQVKYTHTNNRNSQGKSVIEYLILCGESKYNKPNYDIVKLKRAIKKLKPTNRNPMYNTHLYWSQKAFNIINKLIKNLSEPGDVVFDPFMGSGVTVLEAIRKDSRRAAIGCDINEMPVFIVRTLLANSFSKGIKTELEQYIARILELNSYYSMPCPKCNSEVVANRVIFDKPERTSNAIEIMVVNYKCKTCLAKDADFDSEYVYHQMYREYPLKNIDMNTKLIQNSKIAVGEDDTIKDIFTSRNLAVLDEMLEIAKDFSTDAQNIIRYILMSFMHQCKITDKRSNSQWPLWIPKKDCVERNIIKLMMNKTKDFYKALNYIYREYDNESLCHSFSELTAGKAMLLHKGSQHVSQRDIPDQSVSLIITDPPYLEQVLYSEYMQLYAPILNLSYNLEDEIVVSSAPSRKKTRFDYFNLLKEVFEICSRKLKVGGFMCLYFHDSNLSVWYELINILYLCGFEFVSQVHIKKQQATLKNIISPKKSLNGDSILFLCNTGNKKKYESGKEGLDEVERNLVREAKFMLASYGTLSTPELCDNGLMEILIQNGWLKLVSESYSSLVDIFEKHLIWDASLGKWNTI